MNNIQTASDRYRSSPDLFCKFSPSMNLKLVNTSPFLGSIDQYQFFTKDKKILDNSLYFLSQRQYKISNFESNENNNGNSQESFDKQANIIDYVFDFDSECEEESDNFRNTSELSCNQNVVFKNDKYSESESKIFLLDQIVDVSVFEELLDAQRVIKNYNCKYCGEVFKNGCALGGHISKVHKGKATTYSKRLGKNKISKTDMNRGRFLRSLLDEHNISS